MRGRDLFSKAAYRSLPQGHGPRQELAQLYCIVTGLADVFLRGCSHLLEHGAVAVVHGLGLREGQTRSGNDVNVIRIVQLFGGRPGRRLPARINHEDADTAQNGEQQSTVFHLVTEAGGAEDRFGLFAQVSVDRLVGFLVQVTQ